MRNTHEAQITAASNFMVSGILQSGSVRASPTIPTQTCLDEQTAKLPVSNLLMDVPIPEVYVQVTQALDGTEQYGVVDDKVSEQSYNSSV